jgi:hypothetical protein
MTGSKRHESQGNLPGADGIDPPFVLAPQYHVERLLAQVRALIQGTYGDSGESFRRLRARRLRSPSGHEPQQIVEPVYCRTVEHLVECRVRQAKRDIISVEQEEAARKPH